MPCIYRIKFCLHYISYKFRIRTINNKHYSFFKEIILYRICSFFKCKKTFLTCYI